MCTAHSAARRTRPVLLTPPRGASYAACAAHPPTPPDGCDIPIHSPPINGPGGPGAGSHPGSHARMRTTPAYSEPGSGSPGCIDPRCHRLPRTPGLVPGFGSPGCIDPRCHYHVKTRQWECDTDRESNPRPLGCMSRDSTTRLKRSAVMSGTGIHRLIYRDICVECGASYAACAAHKVVEMVL